MGFIECMHVCVYIACVYVLTHIDIHTYVHNICIFAAFFLCYTSVADMLLGDIFSQVLYTWREFLFWQTHLPSVKMCTVFLEGMLLFLLPTC